MTSPIPPCPVCGKVPNLIMYGGKFPFASDLCRCLSDANLIGNSDRTFPVCWENGVNILLGRALSSRGIHTIAQLDAAIKPDPRVVPMFWTPIPPTSEMDPGKDVLLMCQNPSGKTYVVIGCWIPQYWDEVCDEDNSEYCEEKDEYFCTAGWYEQIQNWDDYGSIAITDTVTHYMPIPKLITADAALAAKEGKE